MLLGLSATPDECPPGRAKRLKTQEPQSFACPPKNLFGSEPSTCLRSLGRRADARGLRTEQGCVSRFIPSPSLPNSPLPCRALARLRSCSGRSRTLPLDSASQQCLDGRFLLQRISGWSLIWTDFSESRVPDSGWFVRPTMHLEPDALA